MKRIFIFLVAIFLCHFIKAQVSQFPQIYYSGQTGGNSLIRANASLSASTLTTLRGNYNIGAESITSSTESYGTATWARVCLPGTSSTNNTPTYGYTMYGSYYIRISENNNYAIVNTTNDALGVRTCAGCIGSRVTISGQNAYYGKNSILALTGNTSSGWYEIYLTNNCSQTTGWVDGQYLTFPSTQAYKIIAGSVTNSPNSAFIWGASINFSSLTSVNTTEGFFQYKVPTNWSGTLTCSHPSYNTSSPTSISILANNHYYTNNFVLSYVTPCTAVSVTTHPQSQSKTVGNTATFSVVAGGTSPYTYQWKKNGTNISGATSSSYTTPTLTLSDNGNTYSCYLTNCSGNNNATSNSATLTVTNNCTAVSVTTHPQSQSKTVGNTATFSVVAGGTSPYTYQWKKNGTNISGATSSSYTTPTLTLTDNGNTYSCYLTNCSGNNNATSNSATLTVTNNCTAVSVTTHPQSQSKTVGNTATFSVVAGGTSPYTYQWKKNGTNISGATSSSYTTPTLTLTDNGNTYSCYLTNCSGNNNATSNSATLTVTNNCTAVSVTTHPQSQSKTVGNTATFSVVAGGTSPYTYQWKKNGTNISGATSSSYTTPTLTLTDNGNTYSCYLTNCSGGNNATSSSATLTLTNNTPSQIKINNIIKGNYRFAPISLMNINTNQSPNIIKICADASKATEITFTNNTGINSNNIRFLIASDRYGSNSDRSGYFMDGDKTINGNVITAKLSHPKYLDTLAKYRPDAIQIVDINNSNVPIFEIPIHIYRAPIVMVHGFTGGGSSEEFNITRDKLINTGKYFRAFLYVSNYHVNSLKKFETNKDVVPNSINNVFETIRNAGFSCGKADVVGFSMGGCLSRLYLQSQDYKYKEDIHKLITINTPHSGSQWANMVKNSVALSFLFTDYILAQKTRDILNGEDPIQIGFGAINDLSIGSDALDNLNTFPLLNNSIVPTHCISTKISSVLNNDNLIYSMINAAIINNNSNIPDFLSYLFYNQDSDGAVAVPSQSGGFNFPYLSESGEKFHLGANSFEPVVDELKFALENNSSNMNYFSQNGFSPIHQNSHFRLIAQDTISQQNLIQEGSITINYPTIGQSFDKGTTIPISVSSINGIDRILFVGINTFEKTTTIDTFLSNGDINFNIPDNAFGRIKLVVLGFNNGNYVDRDTVTININQTATLDSIVSYSTPIYLQELYTGAVDLNAFYNDGYNYMVYDNDGVQYSLADTNIAKYYYGNLIYGKKKGSTTLTVNYGSKSIDIPVFVTDRDTTIGDLPENIITTIKKNPVNNTRALKIYPNPSTGEFTLHADVETGEQIRIEVFNQTGQSILFKVDKSTTKNYIKNISLSQFSSGVYYIILSTKSASYTNKILLTK